jgi:hypothetical protein
MPRSLPSALSASSVLSRRTLLQGLAVTGLAVPLLSACGTPPPPQTFAELRWAHLPPITLAVQGIEVTSTFQSTGKDPYVEHLMPLPPEKAVRTWVADRLRSTGVGIYTVRVVIEEASVLEVPLKTTDGVKGFFTTEAEVRYEAKTTVVVQLVAADGSVEVQTRQTGWRTKSVSEKASLADREKAWFELVESLMHDLDPALESGIRQYFGSAVMS